MVRNRLKALKKKLHNNNHPTLYRGFVVGVKKLHFNEEVIARGYIGVIASSIQFIES